MVVESRTFGPRGVDGDRWLGGMAIVATCGAAGGDQITCSHATSGFYTSLPGWTVVPQATLPPLTGKAAALVVMVCWVLGGTECNYASELCGRRRQGRTIPGPGDKILRAASVQNSQYL